jgi:hypothetical protein
MTSVAGVAGIVDTDRYPLAEPGSPRWARAVDGARRDLRGSGCSVLRDFVPAQRLAALRAECASVAGKAYYGEETVNVYNTVPDPSLPAGHPARRTTVRGNAFVARDDIPADFIIHRLYTCERFQRFLADCFGLPAVYPLADPLAGLTVNVVRPGQEHPWHFDTNEFAVSMVTQEPARGGEFQYCPHIRSAGAENLEDVDAVLRGAGDGLVRRLSLRPGDLQLFHGRYSLHRVTQVRGTEARQSAIFAYSGRPGVVGNAERTRQLFGRVTTEHGAAVPDDGLLA